MTDQEAKISPEVLEFMQSTPTRGELYAILAQMAVLHGRQLKISLMLAGGRSAEAMTLLEDATDRLSQIEQSFMFIPGGDHEPS